MIEMLATYVRMCLDLMIDGHIECAFLGAWMLAFPVLLPVLFVGALLEPGIRERRRERETAARIAARHAEASATHASLMPAPVVAELRALEAAMSVEPWSACWLACSVEIASPQCKVHGHMSLGEREAAWDAACAKTAAKRAQLRAHGVPTFDDRPNACGPNPFVLSEFVRTQPLWPAGAGYDR